MDNKELKTLLNTLRKNGVLSYKTTDLELTLSPDSSLIDNKREGDAPTAEVPSDDPWSNFPQDILTQEQLAFYSAGGRPEDDPDNEKATQ